MPGHFQSSRLNNSITDHIWVLIREYAKQLQLKAGQKQTLAVKHPRGDQISGAVFLVALGLRVLHSRDPVSVFG